MSNHGENIATVLETVYKSFMPGGIKKCEFCTRRKYLKDEWIYFHEIFIKAFMG